MPMAYLLMFVPCNILWIKTDNTISRKDVLVEVVDPLSSAGKPAILVATGTTECNEIRQYFFLLASTVDNALD